MTQPELDAAALAVRQFIDGTGYGHWVTDDQCRRVAYDAVAAAEKVRRLPKN